MTIILLLLGFVGGTVAATLVAYLIMRRFAGSDVDPHTKDLASSVMFRVSALHGLILALVFAQQMVVYQQLRGDSAEEASAVADVYHDAERYGDAVTVTIRDAMREYVRLVVEEEWDQLGRTDGLLPAAWARWNDAYIGILDLTPTTPRQSALRDHMLAQIHSIANTRDKRENITDRSISRLFWFAAVIGVLFIAMAYYPFPPTRYNLILLAVFGAFTGLVLLFISVFENPFVPPAEQNPAPFERLLEGFRHPDPLLAPR